MRHLYVDDERCSRKEFYDQLRAECRAYSGKGHEDAYKQALRRLDSGRPIMIVKGGKTFQSKRVFA